MPFLTRAPSRPFSEAWTLEDHRGWLKKGSPDEHQASSESLDAALLGHLQWLHAQGRFEMPAHTDRVALDWVGPLQRALNGEKLRYGISDAIRPWSNHISFLIFLSTPEAKDGVITEDVLHEGHRKLVKTVETGDFSARNLEPSECYWNGVKVVPETQGWRLTLGVRNGRTFTPIGSDDYGPPRLGHTAIDVPSGEVWLNDWFRIQAFTERANDVTKGLSGPNSIAGQMQETAALAEHLGLASVQVGNSSPDVVLENGRLLLGNISEEGYPRIKSQRVGSICTDLWKVSMIDRQVLVDVVASGMPRDEAEREVTAWGNETHGVMKVQMPPGRYHLYFAGDGASFQRTFDMEEVDLGNFSTPRAVLSRTPLTPRLKPAIGSMAVHDEASALHVVASEAPTDVATVSVGTPLRKPAQR